VAVAVPVIAIDSAFYGRLTFPPLNIALYNIASECKASTQNPKS